MRVTLRQLEVFEKVAETSSYTKASELLYLSQPAVSMQVRQLEDQINLPLFELIGKKVFLTEAGEEFRHYSRSILRLVEEADESMQALRGLKKGRLKVAVTTTANHFSINLLADFRKIHPSVQFDFEVTNRKTLVENLVNNTVDVVIIGQMPERADLVVEPFLRNPLVIIAPPDHPLAKKEDISLDAIENETFVAREPESGTRSALENFFSLTGKTPKIEHILNSNDSIKKAVAAGLGLGLSSIHTIDMELQNNSLVILDIVGTPIQKHWNLVHCKGKRLSPVVRAFRDFVLQRGKELSIIEK